MSSSPQINHNERRAMATALRQFASGLLTNSEFEDRADARNDKACCKIAKYFWYSYSDCYVHRMRGHHRLRPSQRRVAANCVLFLKTDLEYEWGPHHSFNGLSRGFFREWLASFMSRPSDDSATDPIAKKRMIDDRIWPFRRMSDFKAALRNPPFFAG